MEPESIFMPSDQKASETNEQEKALTNPGIDIPSQTTSDHPAAMNPGSTDSEPQMADPEQSSPAGSSAKTQSDSVDPKTRISNHPGRPSMTSSDAWKPIHPFPE
ncbi:hypothetical protein PG999_001332 [Apiospora kogelbergensis]|uniref:Uncharacterized protein n=1 Tax=Apiospora kogelbergensis TaxID=1337665 RepID=A0AAW0REK8_9PEZI